MFTPKYIMLLTTMFAALSPAHAYLKSAGSLSPGDYCNTDCTTMACLLAVKSNIDIPTSMLMYYPNCTDDNTSDAGGTCWLNKSPGNYILCDSGGENACSLFNASISGGISSESESYYYTDWVTYNSNQRSVTRTAYKLSSNSNYYYCQTTKTTEYGCKANYYATSGVGTSLINCATPCPTSDGISGQSSVGNTALTSCHIPMGATGSNSTGKFTYAGTSYYCN